MQNTYNLKLLYVTLIRTKCNFRFNSFDCKHRFYLWRSGKRFRQHSVKHMLNWLVLFAVFERMFVVTTPPPLCQTLCLRLKRRSSHINTFFIVFDRAHFVAFSTFQLAAMTRRARCIQVPRVEYNMECFSSQFACECGNVGAGTTYHTFSHTYDTQTHTRTVINNSNSVSNFPVDRCVVRDS